MKKTIFKEIDSSLSPMQKSIAAQACVSKVGFEWPNVASALEKVREEIDELTVEISSNDRKKIIDEYGDVLLMLMNLANRLNIDPEAALTAANEKFMRRFQAVETRLQAQGKTPHHASLEEMEALWQQIKKEEHE